MEKFYVTLIAVIAIICVSCGSKSGKTEKEITDACVCESCECDPCECAEQVDSIIVEESEEEGLVESVNDALNKTQTKASAKPSTGYGSCRHGACRCQGYVRAEGGAGKCICGHWDYVHN